MKLPSYADHKWVQDVFEHFGIVDHVNVPRFKVSNKIKGFAFVEFRNPESVQSACEFYKCTNEKECSTSEDESKVSKSGKRKRNEDKADKKTWKTKSRNNSESAAGKKSESEIGDNDGSEELGHEKEILLSHTSSKKRKREISNDEEPSKRLKEDENNISLTKSSKEYDKKESIASEKVTIMESERSETVPVKDKTCTGSENIADPHETSHKRKRKNSKKIRNGTDRPILRVMSKASWKSYRNKYLELQKATMSVLKKQLMLETQELKEQEMSIKAVDTVPELTKKSLQFQPGVIIKVKLSETIKNSSDIKDQVKANAIVAYVDAACDQSEIYVRCHTSEEAQAILNDGKLHHLGTAELLKDGEEADYWKKIERDRNNKFSTHVKHKKRGRDKIISKAAKLEEQKNRHIYFDE